MRKYIFSIFCLLCLSGAQAGPINTLFKEPTISPNTPPFSCNLPAPKNLITTNITTSSLSFACDAVAGSAGYDWELKEPISNAVVFTGHTNAAAVTIPNLTSGTTYTVKVWSVCPTGEKGGFAQRNETTDIVIIDDIVAFFPGTGSYIPLDNPHEFAQGDTEQMFTIRNTAPLSTLYTIFKIKQIVVNGVPTIHLEYNNETGISPRWLMGGKNGNIPYNASFVDSDVAEIYYCTGNTNNNLAMEITFIKQSSGLIKFSWVAYGKHALFAGSSGGGVSNLVAREKSGIATMKTVKSHSFQVPENSGDRMEIAANSQPDTSTDQVQIAPNPFSDLLILQRSVRQPTPAKVRLFDLNGREVQQQAFENDANTIAIPTLDLPGGMYIVRYEAPEVVQMFKVFKSK